MPSQPRKLSAGVETNKPTKGERMREAKDFRNKQAPLFLFKSPDLVTSARRGGGIEGGRGRDR